MPFELADELRSRIGEIKTKFQNLICKDVGLDEIGILWNSNEKSAYKAKMVKVAEIYKAMSMPLFIFVVHKESWNKMDEGKRSALILHELMHMGYSEEKGTYYIRKHDVEDFREIIDNFKEVQTIDSY